MLRTLIPYHAWAHGKLRLRRDRKSASLSAELITARWWDARTRRGVRAVLLGRRRPLKRCLSQSRRVPCASLAPSFTKSALRYYSKSDSETTSISLVYFVFKTLRGLLCPVIFGLLFTRIAFRSLERGPIMFETNSRIRRFGADLGTRLTLSWICGCLFTRDSAMFHTINVGVPFLL